MKKKPEYLIITIIIASILIIVSGILILLNSNIINSSLLTKSNQITIDIGEDFQLIDQDNNKFDSKNIKGSFKIIYFGFTYCPDICPTSLQKISDIITVADQYNIPITPIFITIDPKRDNVKSLKSYLKYFHPKIIGLTGSEEDVKKVAEKFKVYYAKSLGFNDSNSHSYMIDHSSFIYLMDKNGKYLTHFQFNSSSKEILEYIKKYCR